MKDAAACSSNRPPIWQFLWAKTEPDKAKGRGTTRHYQPLLYHMLDVVAVAGLVWDHWFHPQIRKRIESSLGPDCRATVMFFSGAHDIGKASPSFQKKAPDISTYCDLPFSQNDQNRPHGFITANVLTKTLSSLSGSVVLSQIAGGHHGIFPRSVELRMGRDSLGNKEWIDARQGLLRELANTVGFELDEAGEALKEISDPALVPVLAGFISVVDWIGSNQDYFPCVAESGKAIPQDTSAYWKITQEHAQDALEKLGWFPAPVFARETLFGEVFQGLRPNDLQETVIGLACNQSSPYLMIMEAPMGKGKTEAAIYAADVAMCRGLASGIYIAMPTQATGNAMFKRVLDGYLRHRGHQGKLNLQLVHGDAILAHMEEVKEGEIPDFKPQNIGEDGDVEAQSWFTAKKRPLLAPFGVGTIDQSLLSVLQTKHWFVRLFGLAGKVVIFDEVHAYDAYMSTILERLLHWLAELNCTVILLSATLPEAKRTALVKAYSGWADAPYRRYPRITLAEPRRYPQANAQIFPICMEVPMDEPISVELRFSSTDVVNLAAVLGQELQNGGCAAVICNTVNRAIEVYKYLSDNLMETECSLFHARTLRMWRRDREEEVLRKFGKGDKQRDGKYLNLERPYRAVLVATQVIEQSLDLDFDLMVSDIAPIDLLLQRLGRLHRHLRIRPNGLGTPTFIVLCDAGLTGPPPESFGHSIEAVYERYILLRTWLTLRQRDKLHLPNDIEALVESVYGDRGTVCEHGWDVVLEEAKEQMGQALQESVRIAQRLVVCKPRDPIDLIEEFNSQLADDNDPQVDKNVRAATRLGDPSLKIVMVSADEVLDPALHLAGVQALLNRSVNLSHKGLVTTFLQEDYSGQHWGNNAHLKYARLLRLDEWHQARIGDYLLTADDKLGIVIEKKGETNGGVQSY